MKAKGYALSAVLLFSTFFLAGCLLPGMIPLPNGTATAEPSTSEPGGSMPKLETDADKVLEVLKAGDFVYLQQLAKEQYTDEDYAKPGTLTYTVNITGDKPTYFNYGWCTTTEEILQQNFEHIKINLLFNGESLSRDAVHAISTTRTDGFVCLEFGVLMSDWPPGTYDLEAIATFDQKINDGAADFEAGDYIFKYNVTVGK
jgi:hypothetical protein